MSMTDKQAKDAGSKKCQPEYYRRSAHNKDRSLNLSVLGKGSYEYELVHNSIIVGFIIIVGLYGFISHY